MVSESDLEDDSTSESESEQSNLSSQKAGGKRKFEHERSPAAKRARLNSGAGRSVVNESNSKGFVNGTLNSKAQQSSASQPDEELTGSQESDDSRDSTEEESIYDDPMSTKAGPNDMSPKMGSTVTAETGNTNASQEVEIRQNDEYKGDGQEEDREDEPGSDPDAEGDDSDASELSDPPQNSQSATLNTANFRLPSDFQIVKTKAMSSQLDMLFSSQELYGKEIWHIQLPKPIPLDSLGNVDFQSKKYDTRLSDQDVSYSISVESAMKTNQLAVALQGSPTYRLVKEPIAKIIRLQRVPPSITPAPAGIDKRLSTSTHDPAMSTTGDQQSTRLRTRYWPPGFGLDNFEESASDDSSSIRNKETPQKEGEIARSFGAPNGIGSKDTSSDTSSSDSSADEAEDDASQSESAVTPNKSADDSDAGGDSSSSGTSDDQVRAAEAADLSIDLSDESSSDGNSTDLEDTPNDSASKRQGHIGSSTKTQNVSTRLSESIDSSNVAKREVSSTPKLANIAGRSTAKSTTVNLKPSDNKVGSATSTGKYQQAGTDSSSDESDSSDSDDEQGSSG